MKWDFLYLVMAFILTLSACASPTAIGTSQPAFSDQVATVVAATMQAFPSNTPESTAGSACPESTTGTQLLRNEEMGYCLLYPNGHNRLDPNPSEVCLVPGGPTMACHSANAFINVEDAAGRTVAQIADEIIVKEQAVIPGIEIQRTNHTVSGEAAVVLDGLSGVASTRQVFIIHEEHLYHLTFIPWNEGEEGFTNMETLYTTIIDSFTFVP